MAYKRPGRFDRKGWAAKTDADEGFSPKAAGGGVLRAIAMAVVLALCAAATVYFTGLDERVLSWVVNFGSFVVLGLAAFITARKQASHGLFYGACIGVGYAVLTLLLGTLLFPPFVGFSPFLKRLGFSAIAGVSGGILGVNS